MRNSMTRAALSIAVASAGLLGFAGVADAAPSACTTSNQGSGGSAYCAGGDGLFRVTITCRRPNGAYYFREGVWRAPGLQSHSTAWCDGDNSRVTYIGVQKRNM